MTQGDRYERDKVVGAGKDGPRVGHEHVAEAEIFRCSPRRVSPQRLGEGSPGHSPSRSRIAIPSITASPSRLPSPIRYSNLTPSPLGVENNTGS